MYSGYRVGIGLIEGFVAETHAKAFPSASFPELVVQESYAFRVRRRRLNAI